MGQKRELFSKLEAAQWIKEPTGITAEIPLSSSEKISLEAILLSQHSINVKIYRSAGSQQKDMKTVSFKQADLTRLTFLKLNIVAEANIQSPGRV